MLKASSIGELLIVVPVPPKNIAILLSHHMIAAAPPDKRPRFASATVRAPPGSALRTSTQFSSFRDQGGNIYLVSPETAVASALKGRLTDPRELGIAPPFIPQPRKFHLDDGMILRPLPPEERMRVEIIRGPNIGSPPENTPFPADIDGEITIKVGDKITTDHIIPAGARMKYRSNIPRYARYVFEILDRHFHERATRIRDEGRHNIIVAGHSYGQGSSREHAAICPMYLGVKVCWQNPSNASMRPIYQLRHPPWFLKTKGL